MVTKAQETGTILRSEDPGATALVAPALLRVQESGGLHLEELADLLEVRAILDAPAELRRRCIIQASRDGLPPGPYLLSAIAREPAGLTARDIEAVLPPPCEGPPPREQRERARALENGIRLDALAGQVEATWASLNADARALLKPRIELVAASFASRVKSTGPGREGAGRLLRVICDGEPIPYELIVTGFDDAGWRLRAAIAASPEPDDARREMVALLAAFHGSGRPGIKWREEAASVRKKMHEPAALIADLLDATLGAQDYVQQHPPGFTIYVTDGNEGILCGLAVLAAIDACTAAGLLPRLRRLAIKTSAVTPSKFPRSQRTALLCVQALAEAARPETLTELLNIERGIRNTVVLKRVREHIDAIAAERGMDPLDLREHAAETHGLAVDGTRRAELSGGWTALIEAGSRTVQLSFLDEAGALRKSPSAAVREASARAIVALRADLKSLRATIATERARIDALLAADRRWDMARWRELYVDHPVTGQLTRALIWTFGQELTGIPIDTSTVMTSDGGQAPIPASADVRLWHPVHAAASDVRAWRQLLLAREIAQPVKQAFREIYVLTPAEAAAEDYSNRFAGHVFRQAQARVLMTGRGWTANALGNWRGQTGPGVARRGFPGSRLSASFFFDPAGDGETEPPGSLVTYCTSDQLRFFDRATTDPVLLAAVPPHVFSEAMRDVDLFIAVASIGADPEWVNRGEGRLFMEYWNSYGFGALDASAEVRRDVLAALLPRLAIAGRCALEERFLVVRGDQRTYRIHLRSASVLMSPDDQYLCIVAARDARAGKVFLPFDDDPVLSLILSKAFLLANDTKITDQSIIGQIGVR